MLYIWGISFFPDIRRVFEYHGAEHKSICTFEAGEELTVAHARRHPTAHARCGTSFILVVLSGQHPDLHHLSFLCSRP